MGSLCSKPNTHNGGHQVLGSSSTDGQSVMPASPSSPRNESPEERRLRMARAAEERIQKDRDRLVNRNNPNAGRLASQVNKPVRQLTTQQREEEPLRWD